MKIRTEFTEEELIKYPELNNPDNVAALTHILNRPANNKNCIALTLGTTGQGKSWVNLRMAELLMVMQGKVFDPNTRVLFYLKDLLAYTNTKDLPVGDVSVAEELGVSFGARNWQKNIDYSKLLQTYRDLRTIGFFNLPFSCMADKHLRLLSHIQIEMRTRKGSQNVCKLFVLQHNPSARSEDKAVYKKYLRHKTINDWGFKKIRAIKKLYWEKPSKEVLDVYLPMQSKFKSDLRLNLEAKAKAQSQQEEDKPRQSKREIVYKLYLKGLSNKEIASITDLTIRSIERYVKEYKDKKKNDKKAQDSLDIADISRENTLYTETTNSPTQQLNL